MGRIFRQQIVAGSLAVVLLTVPLVLYSFAAHAVFQGGSQLGVGVGATLFAILLTLIIRFPQAMTFVNRSSLSQIARPPVASDACDRLRGDRSDTCRRLERCTFYD